MAKDKNMNQDAANDEEMTVTLTLDDGTELESRSSPHRLQHPDSYFCPLP